jgi:hypothetical protein
MPTTIWGASLSRKLHNLPTLTGPELGEQRRLVFENVAGGVPLPDIMAAFSLSQLEVEQHVAFVGKKIAEYRFKRHMPPLATNDTLSIRWNRKALLETLRKLGPKFLSSELLLPSIHVQKVTNSNELREAARNVRASE